MLIIILLCVCVYIYIYYVRMIHLLLVFYFGLSVKAKEGLFAILLTHMGSYRHQNSAAVLLTDMKIVT